MKKDHNRTQAEKANRIMGDLYTALSKLEDRALASSGVDDLTVSELHVLAAVGERGHKTMSEVADVLDISISSLTTAINKLVKKGYVDRQRSAKDRRIVQIFLTEKGIAVSREQGKERVILAEKLLSRLSDQESESVLSSLTTLDEYLGMMTAVPIREPVDHPYRDVKLGDRVLPKGLIQGGMSIGYSGGRLAAAVVLCGGMGIIGAGDIGAFEKDYDKNPAEANKRAMVREIEAALKAIKKAEKGAEKKEEKAAAKEEAAAAKAEASAKEVAAKGKASAKEVAAKGKASAKEVAAKAEASAKEKSSKTKVEKPGILGVNIPHMVEDYRGMVQAAEQAGCQAIITGAGLPMGLPGMVEDKSILLIPVISSVRAANLIMKNWNKKYGRLPDAFIFENAYAGGRLGYKNYEVARGIKHYYKTITEIKTAIGQIPLIVAGGITCRADGENAYPFGADAIQAGSLFVTTKECTAPKAAKQAILKTTQDDIILVRDQHGRPCRVVDNHFVAGQEGKEMDFTAGLLAAVRGDMSHGLIPCGARAWRQDKMRTVAEIYGEFFD